jgi:hypothetical protein
MNDGIIELRETSIEVCCSRLTTSRCWFTSWPACSSSSDGGFKEFRSFGAVAGSPAEVVRQKRLKQLFGGVELGCPDLLIALQRRELVHPSQTIQFAPQHIPVIV